MSSTKLKRKLLEAQKEWRRENRNSDIAGDSGFMPGVLKGFDETLRIVREFQREELQRAMTERRKMTRWSSGLLYRACRTAYGRLKYSDRAGAIRALKRALDQATS